MCVRSGSARASKNCRAVMTAFYWMPKHENAPFMPRDRDSVGRGHFGIPTSAQPKTGNAPVASALAVAVENCINLTKLRPSGKSCGYERQMNECPLFTQIFAGIPRHKKSGSTNDTGLADVQATGFQRRISLTLVLTISTLGALCSSHWIPTFSPCRACR